MILHRHTHDYVKDGIRWYYVYPAYSLYFNPYRSDWWDQYPSDMMKDVENPGPLRLDKLVHEKLFTILCLQYEIKDV